MVSQTSPGGRIARGVRRPGRHRREPMTLDILLLIVGLALLLGGGDFMVRGASALARNLGVSPLAIGLTVVAFGTSAPELTVNVLAALRDTGDISFGNIVGSNMANIGLIIGVAALIHPLELHATVIRREIPFMILASTVAILLALDALIPGMGAGAYQTHDGIFLLVLFVGFLLVSAMRVRKDRAGDPLIETLTDEAGAKRTAIGWSVLMTVGGMAALLYGGHLTVDSAVSLARGLGVPEFVIGLTLVAVGTSLPELATALVATARRQSDIAIGNVVGSNIFNLLFVLGVTATIRPVGIPVGGLVDLLAMFVLAALLFPFAVKTSLRRITRAEGTCLLALYVGYLVWRTVL
jgi:cation:H+ antiporter